MLRYVNRFVDCVGSVVSPLRRRAFWFRGRRVPYWVHRYNRTWANERAVEVALGMRVAKSVSSKDVLEIGNVLAHYGLSEHTVIDKYEKHPRAINIDIMDFTPVRLYDRIISISTVEHVGRDESPRSRDKAIRAVGKIKHLLTPDGFAFVTIPLGVNRWLDSALFANIWEDSEIVFLKRISFVNEWCEVDREEAEYSGYGVHFPAANCIAVMLLGASQSSATAWESLLGKQPS